MSQAIEDLRHEHEAILFSLDVLAGMIAQAAAGKAPDEADLLGFIGFLKEFADKCHHGKEEGILFPALVEAGIPNEGGPIGVMLAEHVQGRALIADMETALDGGWDAPRFIRAAEGYTALLRSHIGKENGVLFPRAEKVLAAESLARIFAGFENHEERVIGAGRHEMLHALLDRLKAKYAP